MTEHSATHRHEPETYADISVRFVQHEKTRHGRHVYYFRVGRGRRQRLPDNPSEIGFWKEYTRLVEQSSCVENVKGRALAQAERVRASLPPSAATDVERVLLSRFRNAVSRDKKTPRTILITRDWVITEVRRQSHRCLLTGIPFSTGRTLSRVNAFSPSLDRIDNRLGYCIGNVRIVCAGVNFMLNDFGEEVFGRVAEAYINHHPTGGTSKTHTSKHHA